MRCPFCGHDDSQVKDSRPTEDNAAIRRRRQCEGCGARFTTFERIQLRDLTVVKSEGKREPFEREKLERSLVVACRKRPGRRGTDRETRIGHSASARDAWRKRDRIQTHRRIRHGWAEGARQRRLHPLRLGLQGFQRSTRFRGLRGERCRSCNKINWLPKNRFPEPFDCPQGGRSG